MSGWGDFPQGSLPQNIVNVAQMQNSQDCYPSHPPPPTQRPSWTIPPPAPPRPQQWQIDQQEMASGRFLGIPEPTTADGRFSYSHSHSTNHPEIPEVAHITFPQHQEPQKMMYSNQFDDATPQPYGLPSDNRHLHTAPAIYPPQHPMQQQQQQQSQFFPVAHNPILPPPPPPLPAGNNSSTQQQHHQMTSALGHENTVALRTDPNSIQNNHHFNPASSVMPGNLRSMGRGVQATLPSWMASNERHFESLPISEGDSQVLANHAHNSEQSILPQFPQNDVEGATALPFSSVPPPPPPPLPPPKQKKVHSKNDVPFAMWQQLTRAGTRKKRQAVVRKWISDERVSADFKLPSDWKKPPDELTYSSTADTSNENESSVERDALESLSSESVAFVKSLPNDLQNLVQEFANDSSLKSALYVLSAVPSGKTADSSDRIQRINDHLERILCEHSIQSARINPTKLVLDICTHLLNKCAVPKLNSHDAIELARRRILLKWSSRIRNPNVNNDEDIRLQYKQEFRDKHSYFQRVREEAENMMVKKKSKMRAHKMRSQLAELAPRLGPFSEDPLYVQQYLTLPCYLNMKVFQKRIESDPSLFQGDLTSLIKLAEKMIAFVTKLKPEPSTATHLKEDIFSFLASENSVEASIVEHKRDEDDSPTEADDDSDVVLIQTSSEAQAVHKDKPLSEVAVSTNPSASHKNTIDKDPEKDKEATTATLKAKLKDALKAKKMALMKKLEASRKVATPPPPITGLRQLETSLLRISNIFDTGPAHLLRFIELDHEDTNQSDKAGSEGSGNLKDDVLYEWNEQATTREGSEKATEDSRRDDAQFRTETSDDMDRLLKKRKLQLQAKLAQARLKRARLAHAEKTKPQSDADIGKEPAGEPSAKESSVRVVKHDSSLAKLSREQLLRRKKLAEYRSNVRNMKHIIFKQEMLLKSQEAELEASEKAIEKSQAEFDRAKRQVEDFNQSIVIFESKGRVLKNLITEQTLSLDSKKEKLRVLKEGNESSVPEIDHRACEEGSDPSQGL